MMEQSIFQCEASPSKMRAQYQALVEMALAEKALAEKAVAQYAALAEQAMRQYNALLEIEYAISNGTQLT